MNDKETGNVILALQIKWFRVLLMKVLWPMAGMDCGVAARERNIKRPSEHTV